MRRDPSPIVTRQLKQQADTVETVPLVSGVHVNVTLTQGSWVRIKHGLGRKWEGYIVVGRFNASGPGYEYTREAHDMDKFLDLLAEGYTANPVLRLWIY